jgi:NAD(P)H-dependent FMN reductase
MISLLGISGSLRARSYNRTALAAARSLVPPQAALRIYDGLALLPAFNPDLEEGPLPLLVAALRAEVTAAAGLVIACPEYAHGIPGAFKNLLDWLVGDIDFAGKPVMLINCSPRAGDAQAALRNVLATMSARIVEEASLTLPLLGSAYDVADILADRDMTAAMASALDKFCRLV